MLSWLRQLGFRSASGAIDVGRLLRLEVTEARVAPSRGLRRRTLAALQEASLRAAPAPARQRPLAFTYAAACGLLALLAATAALHLAAPRHPAEAPTADARQGGPLVLLSLDGGRLEAVLKAQLQLGQDSWEAPLREEARLIVADARHARAYLLARLPRAPGG
jgi:hypothetical protein